MRARWSLSLGSLGAITSLRPVVVSYRDSQPAYAAAEDRRATFAFIAHRCPAEGRTRPVARCYLVRSSEQDHYKTIADESDLGNLLTKFS
jgi:hypothetical protein